MTRATKACNTSALVRERLVAAGSGRRVTLIAGPAGCGKTTLLGHLAERSAVPGAARCAGDWQRDRAVMWRDLHAGVEHLVPGPVWESASDVLRSLRASTRSIHLAVDDVHELEGSEAERDLLDVAQRGPRGLVLLLASRSMPRHDLSRLRASGDLAEVAPEDLRFRSWEVEQLFRDVYRDPLPAREAAEVARRTGGWGACLQLFHLSVAGAAPRERRAAMTAADGPPRVVHAYLAHNVTSTLPPQLVRFLRDTSVLRTLTPDLCDDLLRRGDSAGVLSELLRLRLVAPSAGSRSWRCHEPLRAYLERRLVDEVGEDEARALHARAAEVLERRGMVGEALRAHARAGAWRAAHELAWRHGRQLAEGGGAWVEPAPPAILRRDPWLLLGAARWYRAHGRPVEAIDAYRRAEQEFGTAAAARVCRDEKAALACWIEPLERPPATWVGALRAALTQPGGRGVLEGDTPVHARLAQGVAALAAGDLRRAVAALRWITANPSASVEVTAAARVALAAALLLGDDASGAREAERAAEEAEAAELPWVVRCARAVLALSDDPAGPEEAARAKEASDDAGDAPGSVAGAFLLGIAALRRGDDARAHLDEASALARCLGLGLVEAWARAARALAAARAGEPRAYDEALRAEAEARRWEAPAAHAFAVLAAAEASDDAARAAAARRVAGEHEVALPLRRPREVRPAIRIRCFGGLRVEVERAELALAALRPRTRQVLRLLLIHCPQPVHREVLIDALWPHLPEERAAASLHVALSSLRHALEDAGAPVLVRDGDAYGLAVGSADVDLVAFKTAPPATALGLYTGDLFPEEGPAEWVVGAREQLRDRAVRAALAAAEEELPQDPAAAAAICERGLELDRDSDVLWRLLIEAHRRAGNPAAAARASLRYDEVLEGLGVTQSAAGSPR
ncbi:MAG TPA: winged helix-turn-helix domain-containing protein [Actinomycetota bacterium]|nr:winged helix-turn-helix domain-containing protein [Actinomycetota bacterium]